MRARLLVVALVAAVACIGAVLVFVALAETTLAERRRAAYEDIRQEVDRLLVLAARHPAMARRPGWRGFGAARSGLLDRAGVDESDDASFGPPFYASRAEAVKASAETGALAYREVRWGDEAAFVVLGVRPLPAGGYVWAAEKVATPPLVARRRFYFLALGVVSLALVALSIHTLFLFDRGAASILGSLQALRRDLSAEVPRPAVRELGEIAGGVGALALDLSQAQATRDALTRALARKERLAALGRVVAGVAHEIRNPLAAMKLRVDMALDAGDLGARHTDELGVVSAEIARLDRLVADLLVVAGKRAAVPSPVDLGELAARRVELLAPWSAERDVQLVARGSAPAHVEVDAVARLVDNLVRNAVEASPVGAVVEVVVSGEGGGSRLSVLDEGEGVAESHEGELFEPFFSTKPRGTGLGLAISRAVAEAHGGALAYRREGDRTCFSATFPPGPARG